MALFLLVGELVSYPQPRNVFEECWELHEVRC